MCRFGKSAAQNHLVEKGTTLTRLFYLSLHSMIDDQVERVKLCISFSSLSRRGWAFELHPLLLFYTLLNKERVLEL